MASIGDGCLALGSEERPRVTLVPAGNSRHTPLTLTLDKPCLVQRKLTAANQPADGYNLMLDSRTISKRHATLWFDQATKEVYIKDEGSHNGTFVNGKRLSQAKVVSQPIRLHHEDKVRFGLDDRHHRDHHVFFIMIGPKRPASRIRPGQEVGGDTTTDASTISADGPEASPSGVDGSKWPGNSSLWVPLYCHGVPPLVPLAKSAHTKSSEAAMPSFQPTMVPQAELEGYWNELQVARACLVDNEDILATIAKCNEKLSMLEDMFRQTHASKDQLGWQSQTYVAPHDSDTDIHTDTDAALEPHSRLEAQTPTADRKVGDCSAALTASLSETSHQFVLQGKDKGKGPEASLMHDNVLVLSEADSSASQGVPTMLAKPPQALGKPGTTNYSPDKDPFGNARFPYLYNVAHRTTSRSHRGTKGQKTPRLHRSRSDVGARLSPHPTVPRLPPSLSKLKSRPRARQSCQLPSTPSTPGLCTPIADKEAARSPEAQTASYMLATELSSESSDFPIDLQASWDFRSPLASTLGYWQDPTPRASTAGLNWRYQGNSARSGDQKIDAALVAHELASRMLPETTATSRASPLSSSTANNTNHLADIQILPPEMCAEQLQDGNGDHVVRSPQVSELWLPAAAMSLQSPGSLLAGLSGTSFGSSSGLNDGRLLEAYLQSLLPMPYPSDHYFQNYYRHHPTSEADGGPTHTAADNDSGRSNDGLSRNHTPGRPPTSSKPIAGANAEADTVSTTTASGGHHPDQSQSSRDHHNDSGDEVSITTNISDLFKFDPDFAAQLELQVPHEGYDISETGTFTYPTTASTDSNTFLKRCRQTQSHYHYPLERTHSAGSATTATDPKEVEVYESNLRLWRDSSLSIDLGTPTPSLYEFDTQSSRTSLWSRFGQLPHDLPARKRDRVRALFRRATRPLNQVVKLPAKKGNRVDTQALKESAVEL
ncbi:hypothetical protein H4R35_002921 [Dimargaris xerosporica]|nr:hypothetical protein H4R35_002921 [Dimargaris xerosporica]